MEELFQKGGFAGAGGAGEDDGAGIWRKIWCRMSIMIVSDG